MQCDSNDISVQSFVCTVATTSRLLVLDRLGRRLPATEFLYWREGRIHVITNVYII
jgi:hypothetical protein